jgi:uncharacterized protein YjbI with pentapeptide repeats
MFNQFKLLRTYKPSADDGGELESADTSNESSSKSKDAGTKPITDFEAAYKGIQKKYDLMFKRNAKLEETLEDLKDKLGETEILLDKYQKNENSSKSITEKALQQAQTDKQLLDSKDKEIQRMKIVMKEFPQLADMIDELPKKDDPDEFRSSLTGLNTTIEKQVESRIKERLSGTGLNDANLSGRDQGNITLSSDDLYSKLLTFPSTRSAKEEAEYQKVYGQYIDAYNAEHK